MPPLLYRVFSRSLIVFFAGFLIFGVNHPVSAANPDAYLVKGVMVDATGTSALDARNKAFAEVRRKAFEQMANQVLPEKSRGNIVVPDDRTIASAVRDFEIVNEKMTTRRYAGTVDVRFTPAAAKRILQSAAAGIPAETAVIDPSSVVTGEVTTTSTTTTTALRPNSIAARNAESNDYVYSPRHTGTKSSASGRTVLVLPWYGITGRQNLWGQGNPWRAAWEENKSLSHDASLPVVLPVGDAADLRDYSPPQGLSRRGNIEGLMKRYSATDAVLAMAEPANDGSVVVSLYQYQSNGPVPIGRFGVDGSSRDVLGEAVVKAVNTMHGMQTAQETIAPTPVSVGVGTISMSGQQSAMLGSYRTLARFSGLQEWVAMRQALLRVPGMGGVNIHSISPLQANIEFAYAGDINTLASAMAQNGLQLSQLQQDPNAPLAPGDVAPQYMLSMGRAY
jgi:hypothetical protein